MGELFFKNRFRIPSARLEGFDYSQNGYYFITICTKNDKHPFGKIQNNKMCLYYTGSIAWQCWLEISQHFHHVYLDEFVVMTNHVHGIIHINHGLASRFGECDGCRQWDEKRREQFENNARGNADVDVENISVETGQCPVSTPTRRSSIIPPQRGSISAIVGSYKSVVTKTIHQLFVKHHIKQQFMWQPRFYDHVIRNERALYNIRKYIRNNPTKWWRDRNNQTGILM
ncbi:MAG TPA: transposase [Candidatus Magasanikbacteria bacterium]|nr:transposase [Candidatus Magasanikbacteria bacterium]